MATQRHRSTATGTPARGSSRLPVLGVVVGAAAVSSVVTWATRGSWAVPVLATALAALGVGAAVSPRVERATDAAFGRLWSVWSWAFAILAPLVFVRWLADLVVAAPRAIGVLVLLAGSAAFASAVRALATEDRRKRLWESLSGVGRVAPFVFAFVLFEVAIVLFATLAAVLAEAGTIRFGTGAAPAPVAEPADALDFFAWHALDAIPVLGITQTMRWEEPLGYDHAGVGLLVLLFKVAVIGPIVAAFVSFWRFRHPRSCDAGAGAS